MRIPALVPFLLLLQPLAGEDRVFSVDRAHTRFGFRAATPLFEVPGRFDRYTVDISGDPDAPGAVAVRVELEAASINTGHSGRDQHLRSADFFDAGRHPKVVFRSDRAWREGEQLKVAGSLEIRGQRKDLTLVLQPATGLNGAGVPTWSYRGSLRIDRRDFGIGADSLAARIGLKDPVDLDLLLVGFFKEAPPVRSGRR